MGGFDTVAKDLGLSIPSDSQLICNYECCYSTDTPESPHGIYVNLKTFIAYGMDSLIYDNVSKKLGKMFYLNIKKTRFAKSKDNPQDKGSTESLESLVPYHDIMAYNLFVWPKGLYVPVEAIDDSRDPLIFQICMAVINHNAVKQNESSTYNFSDKIISKYSQDLFQIENPPQLPSSGWKCDRCGATSNLWLNLSDGYIGCGRKNYGMQGGCIDGSEGAAITHFEETGKKYPLAVKLSTITPTSTEVYSYAADEDSFVIDTKLAVHLAHFGIKINDLKKSEPTISELELEHNIKYSWSTSNDGGTILKGIGHVGLLNLGNTCYLNSALQLLLDIKDIQTYFRDNYKDIASTTGNFYDHPAKDLLLQLSKIVYSFNSNFLLDQQSRLVNDFYEECVKNNISLVTPPDYAGNWLAPRMFKNLLVYFNPDYGSSMQQDTQECLSFLLNKLENVEGELASRCKSPFLVSDLFNFKIRQILICNDELKLQNISAQMLSLPIDGKYLNCECTEEDCVDLNECLDEWLKPETVDYFSEKTNAPSKASIKPKIAEFPKYLLLHIRRFYLSENWTPKKIKVGINAPEILDLSRLLYTDNETKWSTSDSNLTLIKSLEEMGFSLSEAIRAISNSDNLTIEGLVQYLSNNPLKEAGAISPDQIQILTNIGIESSHIVPLLEKFNNDANAAIEWYYSQEHPELQLQAKEQDRQIFTEFKYKLVGFISHKGNSVDCGHYIYHSKRNNGWVQFNDDKVGLYNNPPDIKSGYCYLYKNMQYEEQ